MTEATIEKFDRAFKAVRELPEETQEVIAYELMGRIADFSASHMNDAQRSEVMRRLANPQQMASDEEVLAVYRRFNPAL